ncbi:DUF2357 domain-containing protein [Achromobacter insolitus]|uniref:DUF2357 domain-containing protein n=1 Tax=Achromobacter insolitus TaxID=217204 RepID=UPI001749F9B1|nr:DUF2357 domain-containing protein [Achromobacter insolitus]
MLWIEDLSGQSWQVHPGCVATGFVEGEAYSIRTEMPHASVVVDDLPLTRNPIQQTWRWTPGFYGGRVDAEMLDEQGRSIATYSLEVGPSGEKLSQSEFMFMVHEILAAMPSLLLGDGGGLPLFDQEGDSVSTEVAYARLKRYLGPCLSSMRAVCSRPLAKLHSQRRVVRPHQMRRLDVRTALELSRSPFAAELSGADRTCGALPHVTAQYVQHTYDHAANRTVAFMVDRLIARVATLRDRISRMLNHQDEDVRARAVRRLQILTEFDSRLREVRRAPVFDAVTRPEVSAAGLNAIAAQPDYAQSFQLAWKSLNRGVLGEDGEESLPVGPTWQIYERWCFLQVCRLLKHLVPDAGWQLSGRGADREPLRMCGQAGGGTAIIYLQPTFPAWDQSHKSRFRSLSRQREPDIVLTIESSLSRRFLVLDAKYRASRGNVLDAMQSAHIYRDSLTWQEERPWASYLLIPRGGSVRWLADTTFQHEFHVGTIELAPDKDVSPLVSCLQRFLNA